MASSPPTHQLAKAERIYKKKQKNTDTQRKAKRRQHREERMCDHPSDTTPSVTDLPIVRTVGSQLKRSGQVQRHRATAGVTWSDPSMMLWVFIHYLIFSVRPGDKRQRGWHRKAFFLGDLNVTKYENKCVNKSDKPYVWQSKKKLNTKYHLFHPGCF